MERAATLLVCLGAYLPGAVSFSRLALRLLGEGPATADDAVDIPIAGAHSALQLTFVGATSIGLRHGGGLGCAIGRLVAVIVSQVAALLAARRATGLCILDSIHYESRLRRGGIPAPGRKGLGSLRAPGAACNPTSSSSVDLAPPCWLAIL